LKLKMTASVSGHSSSYFISHNTIQHNRLWLTDYPCTGNQLDAFILSWLSVGRPANRESNKKHNTYQFFYIL